MKYVVCVPDGCADERSTQSEAAPPLEVASMPTFALDRRRGVSVAPR